MNLSPESVRSKPIAGPDAEPLTTKQAKDSKNDNGLHHGGAQNAENGNDLHHERREIHETR